MGLDTVLLIFTVVLLVCAWYESLRLRELVIEHCNRLCQQADLQLLDQTVALVSLKIQRSSTGRLCLLRRYQFEVSEDGSGRTRGIVSVLCNAIVESHLEGPDGQNIFHQSRPPTLH